MNNNNNKNKNNNNNNDVPKNIPVFYNLYLKPHADEWETNRVKELVKQQLAYLIPEIHHPIYIHTIGKQLTIPNTTQLTHHAHANEEVTLHSLWEYCKDHTDQAVVYLHSKGSYHNTQVNELMRMFVTRSALSTNCLDAILHGGAGGSSNDNNNNTPNHQRHWTCNYCSSRFTPYPHPHTPGNMWLAQCSYVAQLIDPLYFEEQMATKIPRLHNISVDYKPWLLGRGRYAAEHWIASRGGILKPCDLYTPNNHTWGYKGIPNLLPDDDDDPVTTKKKTLPPSLFELQPAPRLEWEGYVHVRNEYWTGLDHRWAEYLALYNETPPMVLASSSSALKDDGTSMGDIWWGWRMKAWVDQAMTWNGPLPSSVLSAVGHQVIDW